MLIKCLWERVSAKDIYQRFEYSITKLLKEKIKQFSLDGLNISWKVFEVFDVKPKEADSKELIFIGTIYWKYTV